MRYDVCPLHAGFAVVAMVGDHIAQILDICTEQDRARQMAGDLNRFAGMVETAVSTRAAKQ